MTGHPTYTLHITYDEPKAQYSTTMIRKSWPSVCGHLQHLEDAAEVTVVREADDAIVLRCSPNGADFRAKKSHRG